MGPCELRSPEFAPRHDTGIDMKRFNQDDLRDDSLDVVELVMELEDEFGISVPEEDYEKIRTVGDAMKYIETRLAE